MRRVFALAAASSLLAACVAEVPGWDSAAEVGAATAELRVCPDSEIISGIDVSHWQATIDWDAVAGSGIRFAFIRVSDGTGTMDREFHRNWPEARRVGIVRGVYQYFRPSQDPIAQADLLLREMGPLEPGDLPPVIDVEETDGQSPTQIANAIRAWMGRIESALGRRPLVYTARYFWQDDVGNADFDEYPLWIANWGVMCPDLPAAWPDWVFWQTSATGRIAGISGNVDTDVFNGGIAALRAFAGTCMTGCDGDVVVRDDCTRIDCAADGSACIDDAAGVRCAVATCPASGVATVCLDGSTLGRCGDGTLTPSPCPTATPICTTAGAAPTDAICVSDLCVVSPDEAPVAHDTCLADGRILHCDAFGRADMAYCPTGLVCSLATGTAQCGGTGEVPPPDMPMGGSLGGGCSVSRGGTNGRSLATGLGALAVLFVLMRKRACRPRSSRLRSRA